MKLAEYSKFILDSKIAVPVDRGCRWNEIAQMEWSQVDWNHRVLNIWRKKTRSASVIPISNRFYEVLRRREGTRVNASVFPSEDGMTHKRYSLQAIKRAAARAGITHYSYHVARHTYITRLAKAGLSQQNFQKVSGHSTITSLMRYSHLTNADVIDEVRGIIG